jgi:hypothetical protein
MARCAYQNMTLSLQDDSGDAHRTRSGVWYGQREYIFWVVASGKILAAQTNKHWN